MRLDTAPVLSLRGLPRSASVGSDLHEAGDPTSYCNGSTGPPVGDEAAASEATRDVSSNSGPESVSEWA